MFFAGVVECVDGKNILLGPILLIVLVLVWLLSPIAGGVGISIIVEVLFVPDELYGLIQFHHLAKQDGSEHLWMVGEHYLFLNATRAQSPSSNELVGEIYLHLPEILLNGLFVMTDLGGQHGLLLVLCNYVVYTPFLN